MAGRGCGISYLSQLSFTQFQSWSISGTEMIFRVMKYYRAQLHAPTCKLDGGFKYFLCSSISSLPGKWSKLTSIFFKWVVQPPTRNSLKIHYHTFESSLRSPPKWVHLFHDPGLDDQLSRPPEVSEFKPYSSEADFITNTHKFLQLKSRNGRAWLGLYNSLSPRKLTCTLRIPKDPPIKWWTNLYAAGVCLGSSKIARLWRGQDS